MVVSVTVWASNGVLADSEALLTVLLVHVRLLALFARLVVVIFCVSSTTTVASDRAVGVSFVSKFPATGALDEVDLLDPFGAEAGSVEEEKGRAGEFLEMAFVGVGDAEANVATGCVRDAVTVGPGWSFYEYGISKDGVGFSDFFFEFRVSDRYKFSGGGSEVLVNRGILVGDPSLGGDVTYDDPGPFGGFNEQAFGGSLGEDSEDGVAGLFDLGVDGVVGEEDGEVHRGSPFGGVGFDVELAAGAVNLADNSLDGHGRSGEGFLVLVELDHISFAIIAGALRLLFGHGAHEPSGRNVVVFGLRSGDLRLGGGGSGGEGDLFGFAGVTGCRTSFRGFDPRFIHVKGRGFNCALFPFGLRAFFGSVGALGCTCGNVCGDPTGWVDGRLCGVQDVAFVVNDLPLEFLCPPASNFEVGRRSVWEPVGFPWSEVVLEGPLYVGLDLLSVSDVFEVEWFRLIVDPSAPFTRGDCGRPERQPCGGEVFKVLLVPVFGGSLCALLFGTLSLGLRVLDLRARWISSLGRSCDDLLLDIDELASNSVQLLLLAGRGRWGALMPQIPREFVLDVPEAKFDLVDDGCLERAQHVVLGNGVDEEVVALCLLGADVIDSFGERVEPRFRFVVHGSGCWFHKDWVGVGVERDFRGLVRADDGVLREKFALSLLDVCDVFVEVVVFDSLVGRRLDARLEVREFPLSLVGGCGCCV